MIEEYIKEQELEKELLNSQFTQNSLRAYFIQVGGRSSRIQNNAEVMMNFVVMS